MGVRHAFRRHCRPRGRRRGHPRQSRAARGALTCQLPSSRRPPRQRGPPPAHPRAQCALPRRHLPHRERSYSGRGTRRVLVWGHTPCPARFPSQSRMQQGSMRGLLPSSGRAPQQPWQMRRQPRPGSPPRLLRQFRWWRQGHLAFLSVGLDQAAQPSSMALHLRRSD